MIRKIKKVVYFSTFTPLINVRHDLKFRQYVRLMQGFGRIDVEPKEFKRRAKRAAFLLYEALEQVPPGEIKQFLSEMLDDYVKQD